MDRQEELPSDNHCMMDGMGLLDDTAVFTAVLEQGGFSHAAKHLGLSNGLVSRRIARLEKTLGVALIKRTTRQLQLTPEGELFWQHARRIQAELDRAIALIQASAQEPHGLLRVSAPFYFGRHFLVPILAKFMEDFAAIKVDLVLCNRQVSPIKEKFDLTIRGSGYLDEAQLRDSNLKRKLLLREAIGLYASPGYLRTHHGGPKNPEALVKHAIIAYKDEGELAANVLWPHHLLKNSSQVRTAIALAPKFICNDIGSGIDACALGMGIGRFTELNAHKAIKENLLTRILTDYDWGSYYLYATFPGQHSLPNRTRLLLDFVTEQLSKRG